MFLYVADLVVYQAGEFELLALFDPVASRDEILVYSIGGNTLAGQ